MFKNFQLICNPSTYKFTRLLIVLSSHVNIWPGYIRISLFVYCILPRWYWQLDCQIVLPSFVYCTVWPSWCECIFRWHTFLLENTSNFTYSSFASCLDSIGDIALPHQVEVSLSFDGLDFCLEDNREFPTGYSKFYSQTEDIYFCSTIGLRFILYTSEWLQIAAFTLIIESPCIS